MQDLKLRLTLNYLFKYGYSLGDAMRKAGYSEAYAHNPQKLLRTKRMHLLLNELDLDNISLANEVMRLTKEYRNPFVFLKALDIICKARGDYKDKHYD